MKTTSKYTRRALSADPKIVRKASRDSADYPFVDGLAGEKDQDYLSQPRRLPQALRYADFGRPGL